VADIGVNKVKGVRGGCSTYAWELCVTKSVTLSRHRSLYLSICIVMLSCIITFNISMKVAENSPTVYSVGEFLVLRSYLLKFIYNTLSVLNELQRVFVDYFSLFTFCFV
jgi:hypothetical protein